MRRQGSEPYLDELFRNRRRCEHAGLGDDAGNKVRRLVCVNKYGFHRSTLTYREIDGVVGVET